MMHDRRNSYEIMFLVIFGCVIMAIVDGIISPNYAVKSFIKAILFLGIPLIFTNKIKTMSLKNFFSTSKKTLMFSLGLGIIVYAFIILGYFLMAPYFDFSQVTVSLKDGIGVNSNNFIFVALYISFFNSLLEEFFFRGFAFLALKKVMKKSSIAYLFSGCVFALYHIAIMTNWFQILFLVLLIFSLFIAGIFFNWLDDKRDSIYPSWLVHMFANFAINTVGFILFDII